jgi:hypothetical protein
MGYESSNEFFQKNKVLEKFYDRSDAIVINDYFQPNLGFGFVFNADFKYNMNSAGKCTFDV